MIDQGFGKDPRTRCQTMAQTAVGHFCDWLVAEAQARGPLDAETLRALREDYRLNHGQQLVAETGQAFEACMRVLELRYWDKARHNYFERLLVQRFAHMLVGPSERADRRDAIPRRGIPAFMIALGKMVGTEALERFASRAEDVAKTYRPEDEAPFPWDEYYRDTGLRDLVNDVLMAPTTYLIDLDRRVPWLVDVLNTNMTPPTDPQDLNADWHADSATVCLLLNALYADLADLLERDPKGMVARYGDDWIARLSAFLERLNTECAGIEAEPPLEIEPKE